MIALYNVRLLVAATSAAPILAACSGAGSSSPAQTDASHVVAPPSLTRQAAVVRPDHAKSWISAGAKNGDLLYISDENTGDVDVYSYPHGEQVGTLTGFSTPQGVCVDAKQNVYVTDFTPPNIYEYAHGGTVPIATLSDPGQYLEACSVDQKTGDLAVANFRSSDNGPGSISVFQNATGTPTVYSNPDLLISILTIGYDNVGNLYFDGFDPNGNFGLAKLPKGANALKKVTVDRSIGYPGGVQWDGKYLAIGDESAPAIYQFQLHGLKATTVGTTPLNGSSEVFQFWIVRPNRQRVQGNSVIAPNVYPPSVSFYKYPEGGNSTKTLTGFSSPVGAAVSKAL